MRANIYHAQVLLIILSMEMLTLIIRSVQFGFSILIRLLNRSYMTVPPRLVYQVIPSLSATPLANFSSNLSLSLLLTAISSKNGVISAALHLA